MAVHASGIDVSRTSTSKEYPLGQEYERPNQTDVDRAPQVWVYVYNDNATAAFAAGDVVVRDTATLTYDGIVSAGTETYPAHRVMGVAQHAIAAGSYGFILKKGIGSVAKNGAAIAADAGIMCSAAGGGDAGWVIAHTGTSLGHCVFGITLEADTGTTGGELITCWINCPG